MVIPFEQKFAEVEANTQRVYDAGYNKGKASVDNYLIYSQTARFGNLNLFGKADIVIDMPYVTNCKQMFRVDGSTSSLNRTVEHITFNSVSNKIENTSQMFYFAEPWDGQTALKHITLNCDMSKVTSVLYMFNGCSLLEIIDGTPLDFSSVAESNIEITKAVPKLTYIRFAPNTIKQNFNMSFNTLLDKASIQSIIDGLNNEVTGKTLTLSKTAVDNAFETATGLADGSTSEEWITLIATKNNWTISLA